MDKVAHGIVRGNTIEILEDLGFSDGQQVEVVVRVPAGAKTWGDGIRSSAGGWADHPELDAVMDRIQQDRKSERRSQVE